MSFKKFLKKRQKLKENEYISAKFFFVFSSAIFFLGYYLLGISYNEDLLKNIIPFLLIFFIICTVYYLISIVSLEIQKKPIKIWLYILISIVWWAFIWLIFLRDLISSLI